MKIDDRVLVFAQWSSFCGMKGTVKATRPHMMVLLDGDRLPMRIEESSIIAIDEPPSLTLTGAE